MEKIVIKKWYRIYAGDNVSHGRLAKLKTKWHDTDKGAYDEHLDLCRSTSDQDWMDECTCVDTSERCDCYDGFISGDYKLESEERYYCPHCNEALCDSDPGQCPICEQLVKGAY